MLAVALIHTGEMLKKRGGGIDLTNIVGRSMQMQLEAVDMERRVTAYLDGRQQHRRMLTRDLELVDAIEKDLSRLELATEPTESVIQEPKASNVPAKRTRQRFHPEKDIFTLLRINTAMTLSGIEKALHAAHPSEPRLNVIHLASEYAPAEWIRLRCRFDDA